MPSFKPAYLIHGDDHGRIAERRARLRALAEAESGANGLELFEGDASTPEAVAAALSALTFAIGRRFIVVDGAERWKDKEMEPLEQALAGIASDTTVAFFAREDGRAKAPPRLVRAVARAREMGLELDREAAAALVRHVGERQQRLLRELEKLALELGSGARVDAAQVDELTAASAELKAWSLADALLGADPAAATHEYVVLRAQGERLPSLLYWMTSRMREAHRVAGALERGEAPAQIKRTLRMPSRAADELIAAARRAGPAKLRRAIEELADLELASRGGTAGGMREDTAALLAIARIAA
jgi:DNA polymerase-3 subunit delta